MQVVFRVILLIITILLIVFTYQQTAYIVSTIILSLLLCAQVVVLIRYTEQTNRKLIRFFESIRHADFTSSFTDHELGKSFEGLNNEFNKVITAFHNNKTEKEEHFNYLLTVIQHVSIGIIVFKRDGNVDVFNNAVKRLLQIATLRKIENLKEIYPKFDRFTTPLMEVEPYLSSLSKEEELIAYGNIKDRDITLKGYDLLKKMDIHSQKDQKMLGDL